jgi:hypothetical protein
MTQRFVEWIVQSTNLIGDIARKYDVDLIANACTPVFNVPSLKLHATMAAYMVSHDSI